MHSTTQMWKQERHKAEGGVPDMTNNKAEKVCAEVMKGASFKSTNLICSSHKLILADRLVGADAALQRT